MLLGVLYWANEGDVLFALRGIGFAFLCLFPGWIVGAIRAGDAKLMMAVGAFYGGSLVVRASLFTYALAVPFGVIVLLKHGKLGQVVTAAKAALTSAPPIPQDDRVVVAFVPVVIGGILLARTTELFA
jgi:Flp pilus assembly protein protease CpaA